MQFIQRSSSLIFALALLLLPFGTSPTHAEALESVTLQLKWLHQFQFAGYYAAKEKGFYRKAGLDVTIVESSPNNPALDAVLAGKADYGVTASRLLLERSKGKPVVALGVIFQHSAYVLVTGQKASIQNIHGLAGKRVMLEDNLDEMSAYLMKEGISTDRYALVKHSFNPQDLIDGKVDAISAYSTNELYFLEKANFNYLAFTARSAGIDFYGDNVFTSENEIKKHPQRVKAFREASFRGWKYAMAHPEEIADLILAKYSQRKSRDHLLFEARQMFPLIQPELVELGYMNPGRWRHIADIYAELGMLKPGFPLDGFLYDTDPQKDYTIFVIAACILAVCLFIALGFVQTLRIMVRNRTKQLQNTVEELSVSEQRLNMATASGHMGVWDWDVKGNSMTWDARMFELYGITRDSFPACIDAWINGLHPDDKDQAVLACQAALKGEADFDTEFRVVHQNGTVKHLKANALVLRDADGTAARMLGINYDITEKKKWQEKLRESEEMFRQMTEGVREVFWLGSLDWRMIYYISPAYTTVWGRDVKDLYTNPQSWFDQVIEEDKEKVRNAIPPQIPTDTSQIVFPDYRIRKPDGSLIWISARAFPVIDSDGLPYRIAGIAEDITERKRAEEEKKILTAQLQQAQKMEAIGTLAGGIAHDFNNMLGAILGYAEIIRDDFPPGSPGIHDIDQVLKASYRAKDLVKQILAFSRQVESNKVPLQPAIIVQEAVNLLRSSLPSTISIKEDIDAGAGIILADPTQVHQIVMNLCTNAFHAMEVKGGTLTISVNRKILSGEELATEPDLQPGTFVQMSIRDTGEGIVPEIRERIFDPFFTTKEVGKGTGLGLSMVYSIVKSCGGSLTCDTRLGEGTEFRILLPTLEDQAFQENGASKPTPHGREHILLIDDEELLLEMGQTMLERLGYHVTTERSSLKALTTFQNQPEAFDMLITDQTMPGMTGVDLARRILQIRPGMPIILCTGYSSQISEDKAKAAGIMGFALKPMAKKDIGELIRKILDKGHLSA